MDRRLHFIREKIDAIQVGLLKFHNKDKRVTLPVRAKSNGENVLQCIASPGSRLPDLVNKRVNLIQKSDNDYLYISGEVKENPRDKKAFSISILKACWFVRKSKGTLTWLQEKHVYDITPSEDISIAS